MRFSTVLYQHYNNLLFSDFIKKLRRQPSFVECADGNYGPGCSGTCGSCAGGDSACNHIDGTCAGGCSPGWTTGLCNQGKLLLLHVLVCNKEVILSCRKLLYFWLPK